jgi:hypothetical protein
MHHVAARYQVLKDELFMLLPEIERVRAPYHKQEMALIERVLVQGVKTGKFRTMDTMHISKVLVNTLKGLEIPMYVSNEVNYDKREVDDLMSLLVYGITEKVD